MDAARKQAQELIDAHPVVLFTKSWCSYCRSSKQLLNQLGAEYKFIDLDREENGAEIQDALEEMTGQSTVPNIFINKKHIGGNSDLQALRGRLVPMLKEAGALRKE